jgi:hypothetical protein
MISVETAEYGCGGRHHRVGGGAHGARGQRPDLYTPLIVPSLPPVFASATAAIRAK